MPFRWHDTLQFFWPSLSLANLLSPHGTPPVSLALGLYSLFLLIPPTQAAERLHEGAVPFGKAVFPHTMTHHPDLPLGVRMWRGK